MLPSRTFHFLRRGRPTRLQHERSRSNAHSPIPIPSTWSGDAIYDVELANIHQLGSRHYSLLTQTDRRTTAVRCEWGRGLVLSC